ncbi:hypothetical protein CKJ70_05055 [Mycobacterium avium]|nr:hypothetical protein CKJ70_05055 [Mycobacterium avium]
MSLSTMIIGHTHTAGKENDSWILVVGFTKAFAKEAGRYGIRCNAVSPGTTKTPGASALIEKWGGEETLVKAYPLGRLGEPIDQANAILFFCSDLSSWITGQILSVSGGYSMVD